ncbi:hypothetical protein JVT61DRAFT_2707 [Boletus reticuloceps]|uniref:Uncharacterized protein n=1 Tax=Boletus reticuloceps TaxID=495285 RepID=A0A8I3A8H7_9AGAM|nr:hypothetical protein JVT61DRAFT_2707 [Boletus reticuloceps]
MDDVRWCISSTLPRTNNPRLCVQTFGLCAMRRMGSPSAEVLSISPLAIGRVSRKTSCLNTPGQNDGGFTLEVDGRPVIHRTDVFYRNNVAQRVDEDGDVAQPAEFLGLFLGSVQLPTTESRYAHSPSSTFFGGHGKAYATPKQQYTWFKDFAIARYD